MAHFDSITEQKLILKRKLLENQNVVDLLMNVGDNVADFTHYKTGSRSPAKDYVKTRFFVPGTEQVDHNYITMKSRIVYAANNVVDAVEIIIYVICNDAQADMLQGTRADLIANEVDMILNSDDPTLFGYGGIVRGNAEEVRFADGISGWQIPYRTHEINRKAELLSG